MTQDLGASDEQWARPVGIGRQYIVSSLGRVRNNDTGRILFGEVDRNGYRAVNVTDAMGKKLKRRVHVLVCEAFHGSRPEGAQVAHFDGVRLNNRKENLRWASRSENMLDAVRHGTLSAMKLSADQVAEIRKSSDAHRAIARRMGVGEAAIRKIRNGENWK